MMRGGGSGGRSMLRPYIQPAPIACSQLARQATATGNCDGA